MSFDRSHLALSFDTKFNEIDCNEKLPKLKEIVERETGEMAAREENWAEEREAMRAELHSLRERITAGVGIDNVHEAFRAEIDALSAENAQLKQLGRERDRELAEQRDRADELEGRMQGAERERTLLIGNVSTIF
jgi:chromosome segregation ATPase